MRRKSALLACVAVKKHRKREKPAKRWTILCITKWKCGADNADTSVEFHAGKESITGLDGIIGSKPIQPRRPDMESSALGHELRRSAVLNFRVEGKPLTSKLCALFSPSLLLSLHRSFETKVVKNLMFIHPMKLECRIFGIRSMTDTAFLCARASVACVLDSPIVTFSLLLFSHVCCPSLPGFLLVLLVCIFALAQGQPEFH